MDALLRVLCREARLRRHRTAIAQKCNAEKCDEPVPTFGRRVTCVRQYPTRYRSLCLDTSSICRTQQTRTVVACRTGLIRPCLFADAGKVRPLLEFGHLPTENHLPEFFPQLNHGYTKGSGLNGS